MFHSISNVPAKTFIKADIRSWPVQRVLSKDWTNQLLKTQRENIEKYGIPVVPGSFVLIEMDGREYLADGQHRLSMLRLLNVEFDLSSLVLVIEKYNVYKNEELGNSIYELVNARCSNNGNLDENGKVIGTPGNIDPVINLVRKIQSKFQNQSKTATSSYGVKAPNFDINDLTRELRQSGVLDVMTVEETYQQIIRFNEEVGEHLDIVKYQKCKDGFYLVWHSPRSRWVRDL